MYAPSPSAQITVFSGDASLAPRAAPNPQPHPPAEALPKYRPGCLMVISSSTVGYSLTRMVRSSSSLFMQADSHLPVIDFGIGSKPLRALRRTSDESWVTALRRSSIALVDGASFCAARQRASSVGVTAPVSARSVRKPRSG